MQDSPLNIGYSTCPNDTFIFCELATQAGIHTHLHDVETLNEWAFEERLDVTKLSFHAWLLVQDRYELLGCGAALGRGCGPLVISRQDAGDTYRRLPACKVAVPGEYTTAHLLLKLWRPDIQNKVFMPFDQIMDAVESGKADAGVIIHEGRFTYQERGLRCLQDLGEWWEATTGQPIPLGCIAARKTLGPERIAEIEKRLKASIESAFDDPGATVDYVKEHAQELSEEVTSEHIKTYVNSFTLDLGDEGRAAITALQDMAKQAGIISNE
jgi:1,4-dihydroxy-6-naphthoate synthase